MTTPRIGDTVHYTAGGGQIHLDRPETYPTWCKAAIITSLDSDGNPFLFLINPNGTPSATPDSVEPEPDGPITVRSAGRTTVIQHGNWTPGTWHHIH